MPEPDLKARALALLSRREHTRYELGKKLAGYAESTEALDALMDSLMQEGLLSDARAAEEVLRVRSGRHGLLRIRQELQQRGVPEDVAAETLAVARAEELASARRVWSRKFSHLPANADERARQGRYLQNRGFSPDVIRQVLRSLD